MSQRNQIAIAETIKHQTVSLVGSNPYHRHSILQQIKESSAMSVSALNASFMLAATITSSQREPSFLFKCGGVVLAKMIEDCH